jgi:integrase
MASRLLTATTIDSLRSGKTVLVKSDPQCPGLSLRVGKLIKQPGKPERQGAKSWWWRGRLNGERITLTLGAWPETGIKEARDRARRAREAIDRGIDPRRAGITSRKTTAIVGNPATTDEGGLSEYSVQAVADSFMELKIRPKRKRPESAEWALRRYVLPEWAGRDVRTIKPKEVAAVTAAILRRGRMVQANRVHALIKQFFKFAVNQGLIDTSPAQLLDPPFDGEESRERALSDAEIGAFLRDPIAATRHQRLASVIIVLMATGARRGELTNAKWRDIDLENGVWIIPAINSKNGHACSVPLTALAIAEFRKLKNAAGSSAWVLPSSDTSKPLDAKLLTRGVAKNRTRFKKLGIEPFHLHDLRRVVRTGLSRLRVQPHVAERVLNHKQGGIDARHYDNVHDYQEEKREALQKWADHLAGLIANKAAA